MNITGYWLTTLMLVATPALAVPFTFHGDGTFTDQATGLTWQETDDGAPRTWQSSLDYCNSLPLAGGGWRLPNVKELASLADDTRYNPAVDSQLAATTRASVYWSSSSYANGPNYAWYVLFYSGVVYGNGKAGNYYVRCVR